MLGEAPWDGGCGGLRTRRLLLWPRLADARSNAEIAFDQDQPPEKFKT